MDESTAEELQARAKAYLDKQTAEFEDKRVALGVSDELKATAGITPAMLVALGEAGVKTVEDLADCATDDLTGWNERKNGETVKHAGAFAGLEVSAADAQNLIMAARLQLGWIEAPAAEEPAPETEAAQA